MVNTILPFIVMWALMAFSLKVSYWLTLVLAFPTAGFMVRTFITFTIAVTDRIFDRPGLMRF